MPAAVAKVKSVEQEKKESVDKMLLEIFGIQSYEYKKNGDVEIKHSWGNKNYTIIQSKSKYKMKLISRYPYQMSKLEISFDEGVKIRTVVSDGYKFEKITFSANISLPRKPKRDNGCACV